MHRESAEGHERIVVGPSSLGQRGLVALKARLARAHVLEIVREKGDALASFANEEFRGVVRGSEVVDVHRGKMARQGARAHARQDDGDAAIEEEGFYRRVAFLMHEDDAADAHLGEQLEVAHLLAEPLLDVADNDVIALAAGVILYPRKHCNSRRYRER